LLARGPPMGEPASTEGDQRPDKRDEDECAHRRPPSS
jgi:hypothetical protein